MPKKHDRIFAQLFNTPWLIEESWMNTLIAIASHEGDIDALQAKLSQKVEGSHAAYIRDGISHMFISGPIFPKSNLMTEFCGATSLELFARDFVMARDDDSIEKIIVDFDTPGGHVTGIHEMAEIIYEARSIKPVIGYVSGTAASAGYWLASSCSEMVLDATARVGSIGVVVAYPPKGERESIEIVNSASPNKRVDVTTKEGKGVVIEELDALADVFIASVAKYKGVTDETVRTKFGRGGMLVGQNAIDVKMADRLGSFEKLFVSESISGGITMSKPETVVTAETLKASDPKVYEEIFEAGAAAAVAESDQLIKEKDAQIMKLTTDLDQSTTDAKALATRLVTLEKREASRTGQEIAATAKVIVDTKVGASSIPRTNQAKTAAKISKLVDHQSFVTDGSFDAKAFSEAVDVELKDWEATVVAPVIDGLGFSDQEMAGGETSTETDAIVDRLLGH